MWPFSAYSPPSRVDMYTAGDVVAFLEAWDALDADKSGFVEADELLNSGNLSAQALRTTKSIFASADADHSGELSKWELMSVVFPLAGGRTKAELYKLLRFIEASKAAAGEKRRAGLEAREDERLAAALGPGGEAALASKRAKEESAAAAAAAKAVAAAAAAAGEGGGEGGEGEAAGSGEAEDARAAKLPAQARRVYALLKESQARRRHAVAVLRLAQRSAREEGKASP